MQLGGVLGCRGGPHPLEARHELHVDRQRDCLGSRYDAFAVRRQHGPGLAAEEMEAEIIKIDRAVGLPKSRRVAVALALIRGHSRTEKIGFDIARKMWGRVDVAGAEQREA